MIHAARRGPAALASAIVLLSAVFAPAGAGARAAVRLPRSVSPAAVAPVGTPADAAVADFNGDRHLDIVEALAGDGLAVRWGASRDSYGDPVALDASGVAAKRVLAADVTSDGVADVLAYTPGAKTLWVVPSDGRGGFLPVRIVTVPSGIRAVAVGDFDRNGGLDVAVASQETAQVVILANRDDRSGFDTRAFAVASAPLSIATVALDADAQPDLVVGLDSKTVVALRNSGSGFEPATTRALDFAPDFLATGDLDADGWSDIVAASRNGEIAAFARTPGGIAEPVVSRLSAPLTKIDLGFADDDARMDVVGVGSGISMIFAGLDGGRFDNPRQAAEPTDVTSVAVLRDSGSRQNSIVLSRHSGVSVERLAGPANKLRATITVTNTADIRIICDDHDAMTTPPMPGVEPGPPPAGSLRAAVDQANNSAGPDTIVFNLDPNSSSLPTPPPPNDVPYVGAFANTSLVFHIILTLPLVLSDDGTQILGESAQDTNPFGPDVAIQPLNTTAVKTGLGAMTTVPDPPIASAFIITGDGCTISNLIISGTNYAGFLPARFVNCDDNTMGADVAYIADFFFNGIQVFGANNVVRGCFIGTDQRGNGVGQTIPVGNDSGAVALLGPGNRVGGTAIEDRNVIVSGNDGVRVFQTSGNMILGNIIGTDGTIGGRPGGANPLHGVFIFQSTNTTVSGNTIGGSSLSGVLITNSSTGTTITNNSIGVNRLGGNTGNQNSDGGVVVNGGTGTTIGPANIIANNSGPDAANSGGILLTGSSVATTATTISDNTIQNNSRNGVAVDNGNNNTIGPNNLITTNTAFGVAIARGTGNEITKNSITNNTVLGINLAAPGDPPSGITPNDATDADTGPNDLLNFPVFTNSTVANNQVVVSGTAPASSVVEIFMSDEKHANGEGQTFLIETTATSAGAFSVTIPVTLPLQDKLVLTATATTGAGTSEFGPNFTLNARLSVNPSSITFPITAVGGTSSQDVELCNNGVSNLTIGSIDVVPDGGPFAVTGFPENGVTLAPGQCTTITVTFTPTSESNFAGSLVIHSDDPNSGDITVTLGGSAVLGVITIGDPSITAPQTPVGGTRSTSVTVSNPTAVAVTVTRVDFLRRNTRKVTFEDRHDPFFTASPATFTIPARGSVDVSIVFSPKAPIPTTDTTNPFTVPTPAYQTPKKIKTDVTFVVNDQLGLAVTVPLTAKVKPVPGITGGGGPPFTDQLDLTLDTYDPDGNLVDAKFVFYNESLVELFRIDNTPGVAKASNKFPNGLNMPLTFTFTGLTPFLDNLKFLDAVVVDADGQQSNVVRFRIKSASSFVGGGFELVPVGAGRTSSSTGEQTPPIVLEPRR